MFPCRCGTTSLASHILEKIKALRRTALLKRGAVFRKTLRIAKNGEEGQPAKNPYKCQLNMETEKGPGGVGSSLRALRVKQDLCEIDEKFDEEGEMEDQMRKAMDAEKLADIAMSVASHTCTSYRRMATTFDEEEIELNEGLGWIHRLVAATATATSSMSIGTDVIVRTTSKCTSRYRWSCRKRSKTKNTRCTYRRLATMFDEAQIELKEGWIH